VKNDARPGQNDPHSVGRDKLRSSYEQLDGSESVRMPDPESAKLSYLTKSFRGSFSKMDTDPTSLPHAYDILRVDCGQSSVR
jgi:hypothetical protein